MLLVVWVLQLFETVCQSIQPSPRERGKRMGYDRREKNILATPSAPIASTEGPCPTFIR